MMMLPDPTDVIPTKKPATSPIPVMPTNDFSGGDEVIDAASVNSAEMNQETHAENRTRNTARGQRQDHLAPNRTLAQMHQAGTDFGDEIKERVGADRDYGRNF